MPDPDFFRAGPGLYRRHDAASQARYQELKQLARAQRRVLAGALEEETPGRLRDAYKRVPASAKAAVRRGASAAARLLASAEAREALLQLAGRER